MLGLSVLAMGGPAGARNELYETPSLDDRLAAIAARARSFGGLFVDELNRTLFVYVTQPADREAVLRAVRAEFADEELLFADNIHTLPAQFGLHELQSWYRNWGELLDIEGVVYTDLNEGTNRLEVGVSSAAAQDAVAEKLDRIGIPRQAVVSTFTDPVVPTSSLRTHHRPLVGGLQIQFAKSNGTVWGCTYGFTAARQGRGGYVTNSHCSRKQSTGGDSTPHYQPMILSTNKIGEERVDPPFFQGGACPSGSRCRYSDAAWARRNNSQATRSIARPPLNSITWNGSDRYRITERGNAVQGLMVHKVGRTTGRTRGGVTNTCVNVGVADTNIVLLCQYAARYRTRAGDSGSPVFQITNNPAQHDVKLVGIAWGASSRRSFFSPISGIQQEIGPLKVCPAGFDC